LRFDRKISIKKSNTPFGFAVSLILIGAGIAGPMVAQSTTSLPADCNPMQLEYEIPAGGASVVVPVGNGNYIVDWGDGTFSGPTTIIGTGPANRATKDYTNEETQTYIVKLCGTFSSFGITGVSNPLLTKVVAWGDGEDNLTLLQSAFSGASKLTEVPSTLPSRVTNLFEAFNGASIFNDDAVTTWNTSNVITMSRLFQGASAFNQPIGSWDTSKVTNMSSTFNGATAFNQELNNWNTSSVTNMSFMFQGASAFNKPIGNWNTSNVTTMPQMFYRASAFNQDIDFFETRWDTSKVTDMSLMFREALNFNGSISNWKTGNVLNMSSMFQDARKFSGDISSWNTSKVVNMGSMFTQAIVFNSDLSEWDVSSVTSMSGMFLSAPAFTSDLSLWDTSNVTNMSQLFQNATKFTSDLSSWNTSKVTNMLAMFAGVANFNSDLSSWDVSKVTTMSNMFRDTTAFNGSLAGWNTSSVTTMDSMFLRASAFNQSVGHFDISKIVPTTTTGMKTMFNSSGISDANYGQTLIGWNAQPSKPTGVVLDAVAKIAPCGAARSAWTALKSAPTSWTITDGTAASAACPVAPTSVTITAANTSKNYGEANPNVGFSVSAGYESAAWLSSVTCSSKLTNSGSAVVESTPVGNYVNVCSGPDGSADNLAITYTNGALEIEKRPVIIRIKDRSASAGTTFSLPSPLTSNLAETEYYSITSGSLFESESLTIVFSTTSSNPLVAGTYSLGATLQSNAVTDNYEVTFVPGTLSVNAVASRPTPPQSPVVVPNVNMIMPASAPLASLTSARIFGIHLGDVTQIKVGPKRAKIYRVGDTSIDFRIPKLLPGNYAIELTHKDGRVHSWDSRITITGTIPKKPLTREFPGFGLASHVLTDSLESKLRKFFRSNRVKYSTIRCVGMTDGPFIPEIDGPLAVKRANVACEMAKSFGFRVVGRSSINGTSYNPMDRKAILTLGN
jgi:surface protein